MIQKSRLYHGFSSGFQLLHRPKLPRFLYIILHTFIIKKTHTHTHDTTRYHAAFRIGDLATQRNIMCHFFTIIK